ncbi:conserved hypothetical protein [Sporisorium reilianum SRZ2]|uniref:Enoyl reductase (ER) domain-containing protein n=1 Tax=Sporisorium reilianum (strain SRZ2) TaxID=999809 RepID=E7A1M8_SPORE|nr:conserved hypothetical protein [Sporisorium reilianum SRZ2]
MAELEIIDAEIVPQLAARDQALAASSNLAPAKENVAASLDSLYPVYTQAEREAALRLLAPSTHDVVLGAGWTDSSSDDDDTARRASSSSSSSSSSFSTPSTPPTFSPPSAPANLSDAFLVRSCSQGWTLSFELHPFQPTPTPLSPDELLIRNDAVGLNPVDWKSVSYNFGIPAFPWILGRDIAGTVVRAPSDNAEGWRVGERVWTCADSREMRAGGYQRFSVHRQATVARVPRAMGDEEAATLGTGLVTAAVALFAFFKLPFATFEEEALADKLGAVRIGEERDERDWILIYGGGAITGIYAAQLASLSHLRVITVASPSNFEYLRTIGTTAFVDRHQPPHAILASIASVLREHGGQLRYAMDCVSSTTASLCLSALTASGGKEKELICLAGNPKADVGAVRVHKISFSTTFYHADGGFAQRVLAYVTRLLDEGRLKACRPEVLPDGLAGIRSGLELLREGKAPRARKLVVRVSDTPAADVTHLGVRTELGWNGVV